MKKILALLLLPLLAMDAHAYLDPGTGSMLLQVILGGFAALGVMLKLYWYRLREIFGFAKKEAGSSAAEDE